MQLKRAAVSAGFMFAAGLMAVSAWAQPPGGLPAPGGPGGPGGRPGGPGGGGFAMLSGEELAKVSAAQVKYVASSLTLNEDQSKKLGEAYTAYRDGLRRRFESGGLSAGGDAIREAMNEEKGKLDTALKGFLTPEQTTSASALLASSFRWDGMVKALNDVGLDEAKHAEAMKVIATYLTESTKAREAAGGDREAMRAKGQELRDKMTADLGKILTPEQLAKLQEAPGFAMRRPGGGGGGGGVGRRERNNQDAPAPAPGAAPAAPPAGGEKK